ncbi:tetratricopeptide repeat protein [bacterium]|jgi:predicted Zn-dependent protease|nr:tetratricopeptide repeat protein [bacterium]
MRFSYGLLILFFGTIGILAFGVFPSQFDLVELYRESGLIREAEGALNTAHVAPKHELHVWEQKAALAYKKGHYIESSEFYQECIIIDPNNAQAYLSLYESYLARMDYDNAAIAMEKYSKFDPQNKNALSFLVSYYQLRQLTDKEIGILKLWTTYYPKKSLYWRELANRYMEQESYSEAVTVLKKSIHRFPNDLSFWTQLKLLLIHLDRKDALKSINQGLLDDSFSIEIALNQGRLFGEEGNHKLAQSLFQTVMDQKNTADDAVYFAQGLMQEDSAAFPDLIEVLYPEYLDEYPQLGELFLNSVLLKNDFAKVIALGVARYPRKKLLQAQAMADVLVENKQSTAFLKAYHALSSEQQTESWHLTVGYVYLALKKPENANHLSRRLIDQFPANPYYAKLGILSLQVLERPKPLLIQLQNYNQIWPGERPYQMALASTLEWNNRYPEAIDVYQTLLKTDPSSPTLNRAIATAYIGLNTPQKSLPYWEMLSKTNSLTPEDLANISDTYTSISPHKDSLHFLQQLNQSTPTLGLINAVAHWEWALGHESQAVTRIQTLAASYLAKEKLVAANFYAAHYRPLNAIPLYKEVLSVSPNSIPALKGLISSTEALNVYQSLGPLSKLSRLKEARLDWALLATRLYQAVGLDSKSREAAKQVLRLTNSSPDAPLTLGARFRAAALLNRSTLMNRMITPKRFKKWPLDTKLDMLDALLATNNQLLFNRYMKRLDAVIHKGSIYQKHRAKRLRLAHLIATDQWTTALPISKSLTEGSNAIPDDYYNLGLSQSNLGLMDQAEASFQTLSRLFPQSIQWKLAIAGHYADTKSFSKVSQWAPTSNTLSDLASDSPQWALINAKVALANGHTQSAQSHILSTYSLYGDFPSISNDIGNLFLTAQNTPEATRFYQKALSIDPQNALSHFGLGLSLSEASPRSAIQSYKKALRLNPQWPEVWFSIAQASLLISDDQSRYYYQKVKKSLGKKSLISQYEQVMLANAYAYLGNDSEAEDLFKSLTRTRPSDSGLWLRYSQFLINQKRYFDAKALLGRLWQSQNMSLRTTPKTYRAYLLLRIDVEDRLGYPDIVQSSIDQYMSLYPDDVDFILALASHQSNYGRPLAAWHLLEKARLLPMTPTRQESLTNHQVALHSLVPFPFALTFDTLSQGDLETRATQLSTAWIDNADKWTLSSTQTQYPTLTMMSYQIEWRRFVTPEWSIDASLKTLHMGSTPIALSAKTSHKIKNGSYSIEVQTNQLWTDYIEAIAQNGLEDSLAFVGSTTLWNLNWYGSYKYRSFKTGYSSAFGSEHRLYLDVSRVIFTTPMSTTFPATQLQIGTSLDWAQSTQTQADIDSLALVPSQQTILLHGTQSFIFAPGTFTVTLFSGGDSERNISFGSLSGVNSSLSVRLRKDLVAELRGEFATENPQGGSSGTYQRFVFAIRSIF